MKPHDAIEKLECFEASKRLLAFKWGENDCCLFAADWVLALTGADHAESLRGKYATALAAYRLLGPRGVAGQIEDAATRSGWSEIPPLTAQRGDVAIVDDGKGRDCLAVCVNGGFIAPGKNNMVRVPYAKAKRAWRI